MKNANEIPEAALTGAVEENEAELLNGNDYLFFHLKDEVHEFKIGLYTLLQCLQFAETNKDIPPLPTEWWNSVRRFE